MALAALSFVSACDEGSDAAVGTPEMRSALVDTILSRTERREAFSPFKNPLFDFEPLVAMERRRSDVVGAETETELYYALAELSHSRRDRHLDLYLVEGGLRPEHVGGLDVWGGDAAPIPQAPVRVFPDYDDGGYFVGDLAVEAGPPVGSRISTVNGEPVAEWVRRRTPYMRASTPIGLRWKLAEAMGQATAAFPPELHAPELSLVVRLESGDEAEFTFPYHPAGGLAWRGVGEPHYPGFEQALVTPTFDLLLPPDGAPYLVLVWRGFRETMVADVDTLVSLAVERGLLDHAVVVDVTRSRGGSLGAYALQRLQPLPFKTTFGNLRISDVIEPFVEEKRAEFAANDVNDGGTPETIDDGRWLMAWLEEDVMSALAAGEAYSNDVPFKLAHAPKESDGILRPAEVHFRGPIGVISGPSGGSHLDQFVSIIVDNGLGPVVGMPPGGYSNTWEWEEILTMPGTGRPLVGFMYSIGHTVRPNGEVLEGNPAVVDEWIPLTAEGVTDYYPRMLERVLSRMGVR